jgi:hypothetical protein
MNSHVEIRKQITDYLADRYIFAVPEDSRVHGAAADAIHDMVIELVAENIRDQMICCPASYLPGDQEPERHKGCFFAAKAIRVVEEGPEYV